MSKAGEEWARRILEKELGRKVEIHDDNSADGMYDLRIGTVDAPEIAVECVGAVDPIRTATWKLGPASSPWQIAVTGDWYVTVRANASIRDLRKCMESILHALEARNHFHITVDYSLKRYERPLFDSLEALAISKLDCYLNPGSGKVTLGMTGIGGVVDSLGSAVPKWTSDFLRDSDRQDVLDKLRRSAASDCQVFIFVSFAGALWTVESYLAGDLEHFPIDPPNLPKPLTGVWLVSAFGQKGLRWDGATWRGFHARGEGIDDEEV